MPYPDKDEREEQDKAMQGRIAASLACPKCQGEKLAHNDHCFLCTDMSVKEGKGHD